MELLPRVPSPAQPPPQPVSEVEAPPQMVNQVEAAALEVGEAAPKGRKGKLPKRKAKDPNKARWREKCKG